METRCRQLVKILAADRHGTLSGEHCVSWHQQHKQVGGLTKGHKSALGTATPGGVRLALISLTELIVH